MLQQTQCPNCRGYKVTRNRIGALGCAFFVFLLASIVPAAMNNWLLYLITFPLSLLVGGYALWSLITGKGQPCQCRQCGYRWTT
jgi:hypothetical protein